ncbi:MAG: DNA cytosine methyltransferase [Pseudomonadota bacterium]
MPRTLDLFCGIGGLTIGLERSGIQSIGAIDIWQDALNTFQYNLKLPTLCADLTEVRAQEICRHFDVTTGDIDIIVGGPPCQGFSTVGKRDSGDPRNKLWSHYLDLVKQIRPAYVLIENVEGMSVMQKGSVCRSIVESFGAIGYLIKWKVLRASDYGVPQLRKRVIFLGWLEGLVAPQFPAPVNSGPVTVKDAIFDLPPLEAGQSTNTYGSEPFTQYQRDRRSAAQVLCNHEAAKHPEHLVEILRHIPDGGNRKSIPDHLQPKSGFHNSYARLASDKPAIAVTSNMRKPSSARATHPRQNRGLTVREGLRLQSFNDDFVVMGSRTSQYLQVGNAVPPLLAEAIGRELLAAHDSNDAAKVKRARRSKPKAVVSKEWRQLSLPLSDAEAP